MTERSGFPIPKSVGQFSDDPAPPCPHCGEDQQELMQLREECASLTLRLQEKEVEVDKLKELYRQVLVNLGSEITFLRKDVRDELESNMLSRRIKAATHVILAATLERVSNFMQDLRDHPEKMHDWSLHDY